MYASIYIVLQHAYEQSSSEPINLRQSFLKGRCQKINIDKSGSWGGTKKV